MESYQEIEGDLIKLAKEGKFDVITHGCNCFCVMGAGIAPLIARAFGADRLTMEAPQHRGVINKLGTIDCGAVDVQPGQDPLIIVNSYTQFNTVGSTPLDYEALTLCLRKINHRFPGETIGLPLIGCGLAGGSWSAVKAIIQKELCDMAVIVVHYKK